MPQFDNINVSVNLSRLNKAFIEQMLQAIETYPCPSGDKSAIERLKNYWERKGE